MEQMSQMKQAGLGAEEDEADGAPEVDLDFDLVKRKTRVRFGANKNL